jgi:hypothetical protein
LFPKRGRNEAPRSIGPVPRKLSISKKIARRLRRRETLLRPAPSRLRATEKGKIKKNKGN